MWRVVNPVSLSGSWLQEGETRRVQDGRYRASKSSKNTCQYKLKTSTLLSWRRETEKGALPLPTFRASFFLETVVILWSQQWPTTQGLDRSSVEQAPEGWQRHYALEANTQASREDIIVYVTFPRCALLRPVKSERWSQGAFPWFCQMAPWERRKKLVDGSMCSCWVLWAAVSVVGNWKGNQCKF